MTTNEKITVGPNQAVMAACFAEPGCFVMSRYKTPEERWEAIHACARAGLFVACDGGRPNAVGGWVCGEEDATQQALAGTARGNLREKRPNVEAALLDSAIRPHLAASNEL